MVLFEERMTVSTENFFHNNIKSWICRMGYAFFFFLNLTPYNSVCPTEIAVFESAPFTTSQITANL